MIRHSIARQDGSRVEICVTEVHDGDFHIDADPVELGARRSAVLPGSWHVVRQVHGNNVADADDKATWLDGGAPQADAIFTRQTGTVIAVQGADCAPVAMLGTNGTIGLAHAGWKGLRDGVLDALADRVGPVEQAILGPAIEPGCYAFSEPDLEALVEVLGDRARGVTAAGTPALDLPGAITARLEALGVVAVERLGGCTACSPNWFSHRARRDGARHAMAARLVAAT